MVYFILNDITKDLYVGSTVNFYKRKNRHMRELEKGKHHSIILQRAYDKYRKDNFYYIKYIECSVEDNLILEQFCIDALSPKYNISKSAKSPMLGRSHKISTKIKISKAHKGHKYNLGRRATPEQKKKRSEMRKGFKHSTATKVKMSETAKRVRSIERIKVRNNRPIKDNIGNIFESITKASNYHRKSVATIVDILKKRHSKTREGVYFEYIK